MILKIGRRFIFTLVIAGSHFVLFAQADSALSIDSLINRYSILFEHTDYTHMFGMGQQTRADSLWLADDDCRKALDSIVSDGSKKTLHRFFAAEILYRHSDWDPQGALRKEVARIYAIALRENYTGSGNAWGVPPKTGSIGEWILSLGNLLVEEFTPLLKCERQVVYYGSGPAVGPYSDYRVKDIAASYICAIRNLKFDANQDSKDRDRQIKKIRKKI